MRRQLLVVGEASASSGSSSGATWRGRGDYGSKPVDRSTASYQCFAQIPSVGRRPGGQCSIRSSKATPTRPQNRSSTPRGSLSTSSRIEDGRRLAGARLHVAEDLDLLRQPGVAEHRLAHLRGEAGKHLGRMPDQERVGEAEDPLAAQVRQPVVGHVLLVVDGAAVGNRSGQPGDDPLPVAVVMPDHLVDARVRDGDCAGSGRRGARRTTQASGRFSKARISAVEMLRGPDHIAMRTPVTLHKAARPGRRC